MKIINVFGLLILALFVFSVPSAAQDRKSVSGAEVTGTFKTKNGSEFLIQALGKGRLKIEFNGTYEYKMANGEMMANTGTARGEAVIEGDTAVFEPEEVADTCTITLKFTKPGTLEVTEAGESSGFGNRVTSGGTYRRKSRAKPKFSEPL